MDKREIQSMLSQELESSGTRRRHTYLRFGQIVYWAAFSATITGLIAAGFLVVNELRVDASPDVPETGYTEMLVGLYVLAVACAFWFWTKRPKR